MFDPVLDTVPLTRHILVGGTGKVSRASATSLIEDLYASYGEETVITVVLSENQSEAAMHIGEWALDFEHPLRVISTITGKEVNGKPTIGKLNSRQNSLWLSAEESAVLSKPSDMLKFFGHKDMFTKEIADVFCVAYDESDTETMRFIATCLKAGIPTKDLTMGLADVVAGDDPEDEEDDIPTGEDFPTVWVEDTASTEPEDDGFRAFRKKLNEVADEIIEEALREYRRKTGTKRNRERTRAD